MRFWVFIIGIGLICAVIAWFWLPQELSRDFTYKTNITISDDKNVFAVNASQAGTVRELVQEHRLTLEEGDQIFPSLDSPLTSGMTLFVARQKKGEIVIGEQSTRYTTNSRTVAELLHEQSIVLSDDDLITPGEETALSRQTDIQIIRVTYSEETEEVSIPFQTEEKEDEELSWRKREIVQKGEKGTRTKTYRVARHDGEVVSKKLLSEAITKEPVTEKVRQGTLVKTGKSHRGAASWYAHTGTLSAANPWLPMGSYVKVTNTENGKSVIVKINDRGPFGPGRIIDLDKVAFQEIASLGQGVVSVKMEEITN